MKRTKIRFNLGRGKNYMKWRIIHYDGRVEYLDPTEVQLVMTNCVLNNSKLAAERIFNGGNKTVCSWILCDNLEIRYNNFNQSDIKGRRLRYNPRIAPNWLICKINIDGTRHSRIESVGHKLYKM